MNTKEKLKKGITEIKNGLDVEMSSSVLEHEARKMYTLVKELENLPDDRSQASFILGDIIMKEIKYAQWSQRDMEKPRAAKKRIKEHKEAMDKAIREIHMAVFPFLIKEKEN